MADRRVKVVFEAEISKYKQGMADAAKETEKLAKSADEAGDSTKQRMADIEKVAAADQRAAKAAGLLYNAQGQLADSNGKVLNSAQAAAHNLDAFSEAAYLAGAESEAAAAKSEAAAAKTAAAWDSVAAPLMMAGAGAVAAVGATVKAAADFDKGMSGVQAATHATSADMAQLRDAAVRAGADTAYSATEAAGAITELSKAGVSTTDILNGGLNGALSLAAAGQIDVATAAEYAASAMTQFQLSGKDIPHIADLLAAGAGKAQGSVNDMGLALSYAGVPAKAMGASIEETTGAIALFASNGIIGEKAGTALRSMFVSMANPTSKTAKLMDELGISFEDGNGKFIGLAASAQVLQDALAGETEMARNAALAQIFGNEALGAAQALYAGGAAKVKEWTDAVNDSGYAAETASIMQDNLAGDLEKLGGAFDTVFIQAGGTGNDVLREFVQIAESAVDTIGRIPAPILGVGTLIAGVAGGASLLAGGFITAIPKIKETKDALEVLAPAGTRAGKGIRATGTALTSITAVGAGLLLGKATIEAINEAVRSGKPDVQEYFNLISTGGDLRDALNLGESDGWSGSIFKDSGEQAKKYFDTVTVEAGNAKRALEMLNNTDGLTGITGWFSKNLSMGDVRGATEDALQLQEAMKGIAQALEMGDADAGIDSLKSLATQLEFTDAEVATLINSVPELKSALTSLATENGIQIDPNNELGLVDLALGRIATTSPGAASGVQETADALAEAGVSASGAVESMSDFLDLLFQTGMITMNSRDAAAAYEEQLDSVQEAAEEIAKGKLGKALNKAKDDFDLSTEAGRLANEEFQALAKGGMDEVRAMSEEGLGQDQLQEKLSTTYKDLVKSGEAFGLSKSAAKDLAREVLGVPDGVSVESWMSEVAKATAEETTKSIAEIPGYTEVTVAVTEDGTTGEVQSKINGVTGKTEYVFVTEDGTTQVVQEAIVSIDGVTRKVYVTDDGTVVGTQEDINGIKGKNATVTVTAEGVSTVEQQLTSLARPRAATLTVSERFVPGTKSPGSSVAEAFGHKKAGGRLPKHADGGRLPRTGLGTDKILGIASDGTPLSWVDDLEWVINRKSSDKHNELLGMINRDDPRVDMMKQLVGLKSGGRVGWSQGQDRNLSSAAKNATAERKQAERELKAADKAEDRAQNAYSKVGSKKSDKARKDAAKRALDAAKREAKAAKQDVDRLKKAEDAAKDALADSKARTGRLSDLTFDLRRDLKRGDITEAFTSGSGMSVVDRLFEQSNNKDLSKRQRSNLRSTAYGMESQLLKLEKQSEKLETQLDKATAARDRLLEASKSVASGLRGEYSLGGVLSNLLSGEQKGPLEASSFVKSAQGKAAQFKRFGKMLERLRKKGYNEAIIREIADLGTVEGTQVGNALLSASGNERQQLNEAYKSMDYWSGQAGKEVTKSMRQGGIDSAEGVIDGLESKKKDVEDAFYKLGKSAEKAFRRSLDMHSPSRTLAVSGRDALDGILVGHDDRRQAVIDAYAGLGHDVAAAYQPNLALAVPPSHEVARYAQAQAAQASVSPEAIAQAVRAGMAGWQPMVNIGGKQFYGTMQQVNQQYGARR